jgi:hypothetical protein
MEEYEKLLDMLIADYQNDKRSNYRKGALDALKNAKSILYVFKQNSVQE